MRTYLHFCLAAMLMLALTGCETTRTPSTERPTADRLEMYRAIAFEPPGDYYIGRRHFKENLGFWGYVRRPGQPWHQAQLVMMNENQKFAYDREQGTIGMDDNYEYKLFGRVGEKVYEPATNSWYPEFHLVGYELRDSNPPSIFGNNFNNLKTRNEIRKPEVVNPDAWPSQPIQPYSPGVPATMGTQSAPMPSAAREAGMVSEYASTSY